MNPRPKPITLRKPNDSDGSAVWSLIKECRPLDVNSMYCNLIQCDHFGETCVLAECDGDVVGWISAYIVPDEPDTLFVWQVAVSEAARGQGLGGRMLRELLTRDACSDVQQLKTTITKSNEASWALFSRFAEREGADLDSEAHFKRDEHFEGRSATEHMVTISFAEAMSAAA
ncbi:diaminobutyrate acetyltransferase [Tepidamorphus sp. 3E244]|uniref:diaminobutyrate acetyltransferase n=1 Tax=Tepidamorphus sp. 3E244 TaxID=3385498 RepID=UPI0038FD24F9